MAMRANSPSAFLLSLLIHGAFVAVAFFCTYAFTEGKKESPKIFELVAGEGDNYAATEAPALGTPEGTIKLTVPTSVARDLPKIAQPEPEPEPVAPTIPVAPPEPTPILPAPAPVKPAPPAPKEPPKTTAKPPPDAIPDLSRNMKKAADRREQRVLQKFRKEQAEAERKAKEEALKAKRMTKEEFDRQNKTSGKTVATAAGATKYNRIDAEGIARGVVGGSSANKTGGAGGKALTREENDAVDAYVSLLVRKIREELAGKPGVMEGLIVEVEVRILSNGKVTNIRVTKSSGSADFDQAVKEGLTRLDLPARPAGLSEVQRFPIRGRDME